MTDPFVVLEDNIRDRALHDTSAIRWVEESAPAEARSILHMRPSLKNRRARIASIVFTSILILLLGRSAQLQILDHDYYQNAAETNRLRMVRIRAPRGAIVDRNGFILTRNIPRFQLVLNPLDLPTDLSRRSEILTRLAELIRIPLATLQEQSTIKTLPTAPVVLAADITVEEMYPLLLTTQQIPGISVEPVSTREYPDGNAFAHIIGYLGSIDENKKEAYLAAGYRLNDRVGKAGIEADLEEILRGHDGRRYVEVDAKGQIQTTLAAQETIPGRTIALTIDRDLQVKAAEILTRALRRMNLSRGAVIVLDPHTGDILALVSLPTFDSNIFVRGAHPESADDIRTILSDPDQPLFPRAISGMYPSGSTIKPVIAAAALQAGIITPRTTFLSTGGIRVAQWFFPDWRAGGHGPTEVRRAIAESVNTFFYMVGGGYEGFEGFGIERLAEALRTFGFGKRTGIELPSEAQGLVPTPQWKETTKGEQWYIGDTYHLSIGQGDILVTPLQIARTTAYLASSGKWTKPHLVFEPQLNLPPGKEENEGAGPNIDPEHIKTVRQGMRDGVLYGSARTLQALPDTSAGKTGTAQWSSTKPPHAWFTGFAPYEEPEIVVTVLIEEGGEGSTAAIPVAREIMEWWFSRPD